MNCPQILRNTFAYGIGLTFLMNSQVADCLSSGYHSNVQEISKVRKLADRYLIAYDDQKIGIPGLTFAKTFTTFGQDDVREFLKREKHKGLLLIEFDPTLLTESRSDIERHLTEDRSVIKRHLDQFTVFTRDLGYHRVVILGADARGEWVLSDTQPEKHRKM